MVRSFDRLWTNGWIYDPVGFALPAPSAPRTATSSASARNGLVSSGESGAARVIAAVSL